MSLDWPDPVVPPPPPAPIHVPVVDDREPAKRKKMILWDRVKFLILLVGLFWFWVWSEISDNPILPFGDAVRETAKHKWYLFVLFGLEVIRQIHYLISEHWAGYHRFWTDKVFGSITRRTGRLKDYTRYRLARVFKAIAFLVILSLILGQFFDLPPAQALFELPSRFFDALPFILQMSFYLLFAVGQFAAIFWFLSRGGVDTYFPDDIKTRYSDVWGQDAVLERVKENMMYLEEPEKIEEKGGYVPGGILLWGPPGTGKTLMAEAVAGETGKPYVFVDPGAFTNMFMGVGILKVKSLFRKLRKLALRYGGVIVFYDEADSLGNRGSMTPGFGGQVMSPSAWGDGYDDLRWLSPESQQIILRSSLSSSTPHDTPGRRRDGIIAGMGMGGGGMGTLQALLTEMSGLKKPRGFINRHVRRALGMRPKPPPKYRILTMMATNMPQALDEALLRPGRLDRIYKVGYPSKEGRKRTYWGYLDKVQHALTEADVDKLATITPYATGAIIKDTVNEALITAIRNGRDTITWPDVIKAKHLKELGPPEDVEYIRRERHAVAIHEACHAVAAYRIRHHLTIDLATIEKGGTYLGMVSSIKPEDQFTHWRTEYESDIIVSLASLAGERMFFEGDNSSGVSGDLESATTIATLMEGYWGMGSTVASHAITQKVGVGGGGRPGGGDEKEERELLKGSLGERIEENLAELLRQAERLLTEHRLEVLAVAHALETHKTLAGEDVVAVIEGRQGSIVDGRPYKTEAFAEQAEAYHAMAVSAHRDHASVEIPLPKLNGHVHELIEVAGVAHENGHENGSSRIDRRTAATACRTVTEALTPTVGWGVLHLFCKVTPSTDASAIVAAVKRAEEGDHQVVTAALLGHKADLAVLAVGPDMWRLHTLQSDLQAAGLSLVDSYVSLTEVSEYAKGLPAEMIEARLHPRLPPVGKPAFCFYPMSKRRNVGQNWFSLPYDERLELMHGHGKTGRTFAGRVLQLITGSTGLDDYEWGVTLFAVHPDDLKDVVYTMRFDEASAIYAEFGRFFVGMVCPIDELVDRLGLT